MRAARTTISILALAAAAPLAGCGVGEASVADAAEAATVAAVPVEVALRGATHNEPFDRELALRLLALPWW